MRAAERGRHGRGRDASRRLERGPRHGLDLQLLLPRDVAREVAQLIELRTIHAAAGKRLGEDGGDAGDKDGVQARAGAAAATTKTVSSTTAGNTSAPTTDKLFPTIIAKPNDSGLALK